MEQAHDVFQTRRLTVDKIAAVAVAIEPARHRHFRYVEIENFIRVVEYEGYFATRLRFSGLRSAENNVLHVAAAKGFRRLFAQHPAHRVGYVGFAAPVRPHDAGDAFVEADHRFIRKRFESGKSYFF